MRLSCRKNAKCGSAPSCGRSASIPAPGAIPAPFRTPTSISSTSSASSRRWSAASSTPSSWPTTWPCSTCRSRRSSAAHTVTSFEPFTLLSALATRDRTYRPGRHRLDHLRRALSHRAPFASLDHISGGRAGWNIVTTSNPDAALNFGLDEHVEHGERYRPRARVLRCRHRPVGLLGRRRLHPRRRKRHLLRSRQDACAQSQGRALSRCAGRSTSRGRCRAGR